MYFYILTSIIFSSGILAECPSKFMCFTGGDLIRTPIEKDFPECWIKAGDYWGCYAIAPGFCDEKNDQKGMKLKEIQSCFDRGETKKPDASDLKPAPVLPAPETCLKEMKCYRGSQLHIPETNSEKFPKCWYNHGSIWGCYDDKEGSCTDINGRNMIKLDELKCQTGQTSKPSKCRKK